MRLRAELLLEISNGKTMTYRIKDQNIEPPEPRPEDRRSVNYDALGALAIASLTAGLIAALIAFQIL